MTSCEICEREQGSLLDRCGQKDAEEVPLGPIEKCSLCGRWVCPECSADNGGEADCCFMDLDEHDDDPSWSPFGWRREPGSRTFHRLDCA